MKSKAFLILISSLLVLSQCSRPKDPVDRFILFMNRQMDILEKYKDDPKKAGEILIQDSNERAKELNELSAELKRYSKDVNNNISKQIADKLKPITTRMVKLIEDQPTLLLDENVAKALETFDLGF